MDKEGDELWWLKEAIVDYLRMYKKQDSVDIVGHMRLRCDFTLKALNELIDEERIEKTWNGRYYEVYLGKK